MAEPETELSSEAEGNAEVEGEAEVEAEAELYPEGEGEQDAEWEGETEAEWMGTSEPESEYGTAEVWPEGTVDPESEGSAEFTSDYETYSWITVYSAFILLILAGNLLIIVILLRNAKNRQNAFTLFVLSLLASRATIAVFVVPARITGIFSEEYLGNAMCKLCHFCALGSSTTSVLSTVSVAVSKYVEVTRPTYKLATRRTWSMVGSIWACGFMYAIRNLVFTGLRVVDLNDGTTTVGCRVLEKYSDMNNYFLFIDSTLLFVSPFVIVLVCYIKVIRFTTRKTGVSEKEKMRASQKGQIKTITLGDQSGNNNMSAVNVTWTGVVDKQPNGSTPETRNMDRESIRNSQMLVMVTFLFTICTSIPYIWRMYLYSQERAPANFQRIDRIVYLCSYANPWMNVLVFFYYKDEIKAGMKDILRFCRCGDLKRTWRIHPLHTKASTVVGHSVLGDAPVNKKTFL